MSTVEEAEKLLSRMPPGKKAQLLQRVAQESNDAYPGIDTIDGVRGGKPATADIPLLRFWWHYSEGETGS